MDDELPDNFDEESLVKMRNKRAEVISRFQEDISKEIKVKAAIESMIQLYSTTMNPPDQAQTQTLEDQLQQVNARIKQKQSQLDQLKVDESKSSLSSRRSRKPSVSQSSFATAADNHQPADALKLDTELRQLQASLLAPPQSGPSTSGGGVNHPGKYQQSQPGYSTGWPYVLSHFNRPVVAQERDITVSTFQTLEARRPELNNMPALLQATEEILVKLVALNEGTAQSKLELMYNLTKVVKSCQVETGDFMEKICSATKLFLSKNVVELRAASYRILRHMIHDSYSARFCWDRALLELSLLRTLSRDAKNESDREQALKLIRVFVEVVSISQHLPTAGVVSAVVAVAEQADDKLRGMAIETLCEIAVRNIAVVAECGGLRCLLQTLIGNSADTMQYVVPTMCFLLDSPKTRIYFQSHFDVGIALSNFTDTYSKDQAQSEKLIACSRAIVNMLKYWPGLFILGSNGMQSIKCLVDTLKLPYEDNKKYLLEALMEIFRIDIPKWLPNVVASRVPNWPLNSPILHEESSGSDQFSNNDGYRYAEHERANLMDHYLALLLVVFIDADLLEALVTIIQESKKSDLITRATILVGELLQLCSKLLPASYCVKVQCLPRLFALAASFNDENSRNLGSSTLSKIQRLATEYGKPGVAVKVEKFQKLKAKALDNLAYLASNGGNAAESIKIRMAVNVDDAIFKNILNESLVLAGKDYTKWNWDVIGEILEGPLLLNSKRLEDTIKNTKFVKRILAFYRPNKHRYSEIRIGKGSSMYTRYGHTLFKVLLTNQEGISYLSENKFLPHVAECFRELNPMYSVSYPVFSRERIDRTLTRDYFALLSNFFGCQEGQELLEKFRIMDSFYFLTELRSRDDIVKGIITCMDYSRAGHSRIILSKVLTSGYKHIRLFATSFLRQLIMKDSSQFADWGVRLLITQLYDPSIEVCEKAVMALDEACQNTDNLRALISLRPSLDHLSEVGNPLLYRFMSIPAGYALLSEMDYLEKELDFWFNVGNIKYVVQVELSLARAMFSKKGTTALSRSGSDNIRNKVSDWDGICIPHFYGEVVKTNEGCDLIRGKKHFEHFCLIIRAFMKRKPDDDVSREEIMMVKAALWAVGNIGSSAYGILFLDESNIIKDVVELSETAETLTVRGTCYFVMGLISKNPQATEILEYNGWNSVDTTSETISGFCVPSRLTSFLSIPHWKTVETVKDNESNQEHFDAEDAIAREILKNIGNLSNQILLSASSKHLNRIKHEHASYFVRMDIYSKALKIMSAYHFKLSTRKFIHSLFENVDISKLDLFEIVSRSHGKPSRRNAALRKLQPNLNIHDGNSSGSNMTSLKPVSVVQETRHMKVFRGFPEP